MAKMNVGSGGSIIREQIEIAVQASGTQYINSLEFDINRCTLAIDLLGSGLRNGTIKAEEYNESVRRLVAHQRELAETMRVASDYIARGSEAFDELSGKAAIATKEAADATRALQLQAEAAARATAAQAEASQRRFAAAARGLLEFSRAAEDYTTAGWIGALNNIPTMVDNIVRALGYGPAAVAGVTAAVSLGSTAVYALWRNWSAIAALWKEEGTKTEAERMEELAKKTHRTAEETEKLNKYKKEQQEIERLARMLTPAEDEAKKHFDDALKSIGGSERSLDWYIKGQFGSIENAYNPKERALIAEAQKPIRREYSPSGEAVDIPKSEAELRRDVVIATEEANRTARQRARDQVKQMALGAETNAGVRQDYLGIMERGGAPAAFTDQIRASMPAEIERLKKFKDEARDLAEAFADIRRELADIDWSDPNAARKQSESKLSPLAARVEQFRDSIAGLRDQDTHKQLSGTVKSFLDLQAEQDRAFRRALEHRVKEVDRETTQETHGADAAVKKMAAPYDSGDWAKRSKVDVALGLAEGVEPEMIQSGLAAKVMQAMESDDTLDKTKIAAAARKAAKAQLEKAMPAFTAGGDPQATATEWLRQNQAELDKKEQARLAAAQRQVERPWDDLARQYDGPANDRLEEMWLQNEANRTRANAAIGMGALSRRDVESENRQRALQQQQALAQLRQQTRRLPEAQRREAENAFFAATGTGDRTLSTDQMRSWMEQRQAAELMGKPGPDGKPLDREGAQKLAAKLVAQAIKEAQARQNTANAHTADTMEAINAAMIQVHGANQRYLQQLDRIRSQANGIRSAASSYRP